MQVGRRCPFAVGQRRDERRSERVVEHRREQHAEDTFDQLPFDVAVARVYGRVYAAGRKARGRRTLDLLIAATALSNKLPLYTHNIDDFAGLENLLDIVAVPSPDDPVG